MQRYNGIENSVNNINQTSRTDRFIRNNKYDGDMLEASDRSDIFNDIQVLSRNCESERRRLGKVF